MTKTTIGRKISFIVPVHNEEKILKKNLLELIDFCSENQIEPEILICENGSTDRTKKILKSISFPSVKKIYLKKKGLGLAYKKGIEESNNEIVYFTGIDFPFGFENINDCYDKAQKNDLVLASKAHNKSIIKKSFKRTVASRVYKYFITRCLGLSVADPQGCAMFKRSKIVQILDQCNAADAFFSTQIALYSQLMGFNIVEIPVVYDNPRGESRINVARDGYKMLVQIFSEKRKARNFYTSRKK